MSWQKKGPKLRLNVKPEEKNVLVDAAPRGDADAVWLDILKGALSILMPTVFTRLCNAINNGHGEVVDVFIDNNVKYPFYDALDAAIAAQNSANPAIAAQSPAMVL